MARTRICKKSLEGRQGTECREMHLVARNGKTNCHQNCHRSILILSPSSIAPEPLSGRIPGAARRLASLLWPFRPFALTLRQQGPFSSPLGHGTLGAYRCAIDLSNYLDPCVPLRIRCETVSFKALPKHKRAEQVF
jgi:hypothetical protein